MNGPQATYVATVYAFMPSVRMLGQRQLARRAKSRRDPGGIVHLTSLVEEIRSTILSPGPSTLEPIAAWFGSADRLAHVHPSGIVALLSDPDERPSLVKACRMQFISVLGPRSDWPEREALAYRAALRAFTCDAKGVQRLSGAAKALVEAGRDRESGWSPDEGHYRLLEGMAGWVYWDDEPGARQDV
jgi:hypothetical protein